MRVEGRKEEEEGGGRKEEGGGEGVEAGGGGELLIASHTGLLSVGQKPGWSFLDADS